MQRYDTSCGDQLDLPCATWHLVDEVEEKIRVPGILKIRFITFLLKQGSAQICYSLFHISILIILENI